MIARAGEGATELECGDLMVRSIGPEPTEAGYMDVLKKTRGADRWPATIHEVAIIRNGLTVSGPSRLCFKEPSD